MLQQRAKSALVAGLCQDLGLGCRPAQDVTETDWSLWLQSFQCPRPPQPPCPVCGREMVERSGKYGKFWGCAGYPECRYTERIQR